MPLSADIKQAALDLGFDAVGIASVTAATEDPTAGLFARLRGWLERGYHGTMEWMGRHPAKRADPRLVLPGCRSIISVGVNYLTEHRADERPGYGRIARYAWGADYHDLLSDRLARLEERVQALSPGAATRRYVDTGPVMEKAWAQRAGLGWIGKHSNLVSAQFGSWLLLGEILTDLYLEPDEPGTDLCGSCVLCLQACPTGAIPEPYVVDATRCISYLTIEFKGEAEAIPADIRRHMGNKIFGCDDCLDVCPFNLRTEPGHEPAFQPNAVTAAPDLGSLHHMTQQDFNTAFRNSPIKRAKHAGLLRNVSIARDNG